MANVFLGVVAPEMSNIIACLNLDVFYKFLEYLKNFSTMLHEEDKAIAVVVVFEDDEKSVSSNRINLHWSRYVGMKKLSRFLCTLPFSIIDREG